MKFLVSTSRALLLFDADRKTFDVVHEGKGLYYGISRFPEGYLVAARNRMVSSQDPIDQERGEILVFSNRLALTGQWQAPFPLRDMHQIRWFKGELWVTCTFEDMIAVRVDSGAWRKWFPLGEGPPGTPERYHFNSLSFFENRLAVLAHNHGLSVVYEFDALGHGDLVNQFSLGVQAHNLWVDGGQWHVCSSAEGTVCGQFSGEVALTGGFPRGVSAWNAGWLVGISEIAERKDRDFSNAQVCGFDKNWRECFRVGLQGFGLVLDIEPLNPFVG